MDTGLSFYQLKSSNQDGKSLQDIWDYNHIDYETDHNFIQWVFPSDVPSSVNPYAPIVSLKFRELFSKKLQHRLIMSYVQFLDFIGVSIINDSLSICDEPRFYDCVRRKNHNLMRITRVLRSLTILGLYTTALTLFKFLRQYQHDIVTLNYWKIALDNKN